MSQEHRLQHRHRPAPCIVDSGILLNPRDIQKLLSDLSRVRYLYEQDGEVTRQGEGYIFEVIADPLRSTIVTNSTLYLNVCSFDCLELSTSPQGEAQFDLIQDNWRLRLVPLSNPFQEQVAHNLDAAALDAVVADVLSANWDMRDDPDPWASE